jgi:hypothetical protein
VKDKRSSPARSLGLIALVALLAVGIVKQLPEIRRYLKIEGM